MPPFLNQDVDLAEELQRLIGLHGQLAGLGQVQWQGSVALSMRTPTENLRQSCGIASGEDELGSLSV